MLGTIVNTAAILAGSLIGFLFKKGIPQKINDTIMKGLALCVLLIGVSSSLKVNNMLLIIFSIVIGGVIGEVIDIDDKLKRLGDRIEKKLGRGEKSISEGFVTASLLFCIGAMAVVGSLESGLTENHKTLFAKSVLDGITAIVFTSSLGISMAISVFLYQRAITLGASFLKDFLLNSVVMDMSAMGGLLIIDLGLNMLGVAKIKVAPLLPRIFILIISLML